MRIRVLILVLVRAAPLPNPPLKNGEGSCGVTAARWAAYFMPHQITFLTDTISKTNGWWHILAS